MKDDISTAIRNMQGFGAAAQNMIDAGPGIFDEANNANQKPEPDFLCACNGKACDGICREESGHFRGGDGQTQGGCTAAYRPPKPKAVRRPRQ